MDEKRIKEVFSDEAFVKSLASMETVEEVQAAIKEKGLDISQDEILQIREQLAKGGAQDGELSMDDLVDVAGGTSINVAAVVVAASSIAAISSPITLQMPGANRW